MNNVHNTVIDNISKLPISVGILSWKSEHSLRHTLESYKKNKLFDIVDDVTILFQEVQPEDKKLAKEFGLPYIGLDKNVGIGKGFVMLCEQSEHSYVLLLEDDWELTENVIQTKLRLESALDMLNKDTDVVRLRNRRNPGFPLYSQQACQGKELEHTDLITRLPGALFFECVHWIEHPEEQFPDVISTENGHYVTTSRYANWTNNPCLHRRDFYIDLVSPFANNGGLLLEPDISFWWARQQFKIAWGEGLFTHNDIDKHGN